MKIALITDTHFGARNDNASFAEFFAEFYENYFFPYLDENDVKAVVHLGDVVDRRKYINFSTARHLNNTLIQPLQDRGIDTHIIIGNHDTYYKNTNEINSIRELYGKTNYEKLHIYSDLPEVVNFDGCDIMMTPWICSGNYEQSIELISKTPAQVLFGHLEIKGFQMYKGAVNEHGFDPSVFNRFDVVCSGHFHHKSRDGNIRYLGSPYEITWSDYNDPRGFHIFDTDTRDLLFVPNPLKMFYKIHYDDTNKEMNDVLNVDFDSYRNRFVKVIVSEKNNPYWFDMFIDKLEKAGPSNVQVVEDHLHLDIESDDDIINEAEDTLTILSKYVKSLDISTDSKMVESTLKDLYREALTVS